MMVNKAICNEINRAADQCSKFISGDNPLIYYSTIKRMWSATVYGITKSQTQPK